MVDECIKQVNIGKIFKVHTAAAEHFEGDD